MFGLTGTAVAPFLVGNALSFGSALARVLCSSPVLLALSFA